MRFDTVDFRFKLIGQCGFKGKMGLENGRHSNGPQKIANKKWSENRK